MRVHHSNEHYYNGTSTYLEWSALNDVIGKYMKSSEPRDSNVIWRPVLGFEHS